MSMIGWAMLAVGVAGTLYAAASQTNTVVMALFLIGFILVAALGDYIVVLERERRER